MKLKIFVTPYFGHNPRIKLKHWFGFYTVNYKENRRREIYINSKRFFPFQIYTFIHELGHHLAYLIADSMELEFKLNDIIHKATIPIYKPEKIRGLYLKC